MREKDFESAIRHFEEMLNFQTSAEDISFCFSNIGKAKFLMKQYSGAFENYEIALYYNHNNYNTFYNRGLLQLELKEYAAALADFSIAVKLNPLFKRGYIDQGIAYIKIGRYKKARRSLAKALELDSSDLLVYYLLHRVELRLGNYDNAFMFMDVIKAIENTGGSIKFSSSINYKCGEAAPCTKLEISAFYN